LPSAILPLLSRVGCLLSPGVMTVSLTSISGWIFYSAVNSVVPQIVLNMGFADDSWEISIRQLVRDNPCHTPCPSFCALTKPSSSLTKASSSWPPC
jgi:hypothetical protein